MFICSVISVLFISFVNCIIYDTSQYRISAVAQIHQQYICNCSSQISRPTEEYTFPLLQTFTVTIPVQIKIYLLILFKPSSIK